MKSARTITVAIPPEMRAFIGGRIKVGRYGNASEVVRAALRLLEEREGQILKTVPVVGAVDGN